MPHFLKSACEQSYRPAILWACIWGAVALLLSGSTLLNSDDAWLLYAAGRMWGGDTAYVHFYETNPPLALWLNMIPAGMARITGIAAPLAFSWCVVALAAASLVLALRELKRHPILAAPCYGNVVFAAIAQGVLGCSFLVFGQREHLFLLLVLPYLLQSSCLVREPAWDGRQWLQGVMAGMGFAIKPYFVLVWLVGECFSAAAQRNARLLLRRTNLVIAATGLVYCASVWVFTPAYFNTILPCIFQTYNAFSADAGGLARPLLLLAVMYLAPLAFAKTDAPQRLFMAKLAVWFMASLAMAWLQHKGWLNHYFPAILLGTWLLSALLAISLQQPRPLTLPRFSLLWALGFITFLLPAYHLLATRSVRGFQESYISQLNAYIRDNHAEGKPFYALSFDVGAAFPAASVLPVTYPFHFHHLWTLPGIISAGQGVPAMEKAKEFSIHTVSNDLSGFKPALVAVDGNDGLAGAFKDFDFIAYFRQDAAFSAEWKHYRKVGQITVNGKDADRADGHYTLYSRITDDRL